VKNLNAPFHRSQMTTTNLQFSGYRWKLLGFHASTRWIM